MAQSVFAQGPGEPNDPLYGRQWALRRMDAPCAWQHTTGSADVTVAVVDSGVDLSHPDLVGRLRDDGYDFVDDDPDPSDENGHGTHVAGIIAAILGNGEGVAGLAPGVSILPVRVMDAEGFGSDEQIAAGISYAAERGAQVINLSLGATLLLAVPESSQSISDAIEEAQEAGALVVVAAGNDFVPLPNAIVGENEAVMVVAAASGSDRKANFSNSGPWVDVVAPGENILSTMPTYPVYLTSEELPPEERFRAGYDTMSGTSQATPYVAALAALLFTQHPEWDAVQVTEAIKAKAVDIYPNHPSYFQRLRLLGSGRIDACNSLGGPLGGEVAGPGLTLPGLSGMSLALVLGGAGICLVVMALLGVTVLVRRGRRNQAASVPAAAPVHQPPAVPAVPPPAPAPGTPVGWAVLRVTGGPAAGSVLTLTQTAYVIGRSSEADFSIEADPMLSRRHARIVLMGTTAQIEDLGSSHGTLVNGMRIAAPALLRKGDTLQMGQTVVRFE